MTSFNLNWKFKLGDIESAWQKGFDDSAWEVVTVPHDWSVRYPFDKKHSSGTGYLPGGTGFYRKAFTLPRDADGKNITVTFDGVYKNAQVWVNSNYLGFRPYGYSTFSFDISEYCVFGDEAVNVIAVKVSHEDIADSRWFTGSGKYRKVTLNVRNREHIADNGVFVTTARADEQSALLDIKVEVVAEADCQVRHVLYDAEGERRAEINAAQPDGVKCKMLESSLEVNNPKLWSTDTPHL
jgi:beta-galactosidase/beta-glucuronidase